MNITGTVARPISAGYELLHAALDSNRTPSDVVQSGLVGFMPASYSSSSPTDRSRRHLEDVVLDCVVVRNCVLPSCSEQHPWRADLPFIPTSNQFGPVRKPTTTFLFRRGKTARARRVEEMKPLRRL